MEQYNNTHNYLMYFKSKRIMDSNFQSSMYLCEDQAPFEGFIWPPRSYSCSYCQREFRSAQALGGHMNVHRRDRARHKQTPSPQVLCEKSETLLRQERDSESPSDRHGIRFLDIKNFPRKVTEHPTFLDDHIGAHEIGSSVAIDHLFIETTECKKRKKTCVAPPSPLWDGAKAWSSNRYVEISPIENIDLELRLGDPQTVK